MKVINENGSKCSYQSTIHCNKMKNDTNIVIHNARHYDALNSALSSINSIRDALDKGLPGDLLSIDLKEAIHFIGSITGKIDNEIKKEIKKDEQ